MTQANGRVGRAIIGELLSNGRFKQLTAVIRHTSEYVPPSTAVITVDANFSSHESLVAALAGHDAVLSCVPGGATDFESQKLLIDAAIAAGVKLFFASEYSANVMSRQYARLPTQFVGDKPRIRRYLEDKAKEGAIAWTAMNGGPFFDLCRFPFTFVIFWSNGSTFSVAYKMALVLGLHKNETRDCILTTSPGLTAGPAGFDLANRKATIYGTGNNLAYWTPLPVIAKAVHNMLLPATLPNILNRAIFICGVKDVTQNNILAALEAETGSRFEVTQVDVKKIGQEAMEALEKGEWKTATRGLTIAHQFDEEDSVANFWDMVENETVGVTAVTVREAVKATLEKVEKKG